MPIIIRSTTKCLAPNASPAVRFAIEDLHRDLHRTLEPSQSEGASIELVQQQMAAESYLVSVQHDSLKLRAGDDFGFIYGLYAISRELLGVHDLWFWNDQPFEQRAEVEVPDDLKLTSKPNAVRFRGFFINDEVLLENWRVSNDPNLPWRLTFETVYRLGGNTVIPGSGQRGEPHLQLARQMGLYINQHHACPLGARMFSAAYPQLEPKWPEQQERFEGLWQEAVAADPGHRTLWTLGFRGQGDTPFWQSDPRYTSDESRGRVLTQIITRQYQLVQASWPGAPCVVYLYGEVMDLYCKGLLQLPKEVITIWSDNGFGRMVSRRQENWNPRIPSMPHGSGRKGIYYHVSFYDLQAANHITQLPNDPHRLARELETVLESGGNTVWIINASNIKPHVYLLSLIAALWRDGQIDVDQATHSYIQRYFGSERSEQIASLFEQYWRVAIPYGPHWDDHAGEQFGNYVARTLIHQLLLNGRTADDAAPALAWMTQAPTLSQQIAYYYNLVEPAAARYRQLGERITKVSIQLRQSGNRQAARLLDDSLGLSTQIYRRSLAGAALVCQALQAAQKEDYQHAFYYAGLAREQYQSCNAAMREREHGVWGGFWANDCLTDVKESAWVCTQLMGYVRCLGDGPHYNLWKREFTYPADEKNVYVLTNMENHETDDEIFHAMKRAWQA
ncbi:hypothetical protein KIM372_05070 [Bombiscardovia nodaiensis]|uniref:Glycosyl hydrolase family 115 n=1 Tax=Bombiscardovia nodaiensis TaxID=2932181 RepID=A0ABM8B796_9BIFI|nr:hypothetical protein KIM372_05070 [Bombiscardovia nodaiensis]